jgi:type I restriction enzyme S subunit
MADGVNPVYVALLIGRPDVQTWLADNAVGGTMPNLNTAILSSLPLYLPPRAQQDAVVQVLESAGELVVDLERLIAKKRDVKQGMMQELLTGRTRLPGFAGDWKGVRLGDVLTVRHGRDQKAIEVANGRYKILATGGQIGTTNTPLYSKPSVLIGRKGTIDRPQFQDQPFWSVDTLFYTEIRHTADPKYLFYVFQTVDWRSMNEASGVPSLTSGRVESVEVDLPTVDEQRTIRMALDDTDAEITALERRLESARAVKVGMMQELLTGRTRLPVMEEA